MNIMEPSRPHGKNIADQSPQIWIRLPKPTEVCPYSGLKRSAFENLIKAHPDRIRSAHLRDAQHRRGNRVIWWPSLNQFLHEVAEKGGL